MNGTQLATPATDAIRTEITRTTTTLFPAGQLVELRVPKSTGALSGYFDDHSKLADSITSLSGKETAVYVTLNQVSPDTAATRNTVASVSKTTKDKDINSRRWILIDIDPQRPTGTSSSDAEKALALETMKEVHAYLSERGFPRPVSADSGNGYHLLYRVDLPNTTDVTTAVKSFLNHLAGRFDTDAVKVDRSVFNAARITKAYGSLVCKGENTVERPHRLSRLRVIPDALVEVTLDQLKSLTTLPTLPTSKPIVAKAPKSVSDIKITPGKIAACLDFYDIEHGEMTEQTPGQLKWQVSCPWKSEHSDGREESAVFLTDGIPGFKCFHSHCSDRGWKDFRAHFESTSDGKFWFKDNLTDVAPASAEPTSTLMLEKASAIKPEVIHWLWKDRIVTGKLNLFAGHPDLGKGMATMDLCARVTTGAPFPDTANPNPPKEVIIFSSEDAAADTLVPRLMAAGADLERCNINRMVKAADGTTRVFALDTDLPALRRALEQNPNVGLVIIDPVMNHCGEVNAYKDQDLRKVLTPLGLLAEEFKVAVVIVAHLNKQKDGDLITRVGGGMALVGCSRIAWMFTESKEKEGTRLMSMIKGNITKSGAGMSYEIEGVPVQIFNAEKSAPETVEIGHIVWAGVTKEKLTTDHIGFNTKLPSKQSQCEAWLAHYMKSGKQFAASELYAFGKELSFNEKMVKRSYDALGGLSSVQKGDGWYWQLPPLDGSKPSQGVFVGKTEAA